PLVVGATAARLEVVPGQSDPLRSEVQFVSGNSRQGITTLITGGEMGGLIRYREDVLDQSLNAVGRLALSIADQINSQLGQGLDLKGNFGEPLFRHINDPLLIGQRSIARVGNSDPSANLNVLIENTSALTTSDYEVEFTSATEYTVRRVSDGKTITPLYDDDGNPDTPLVPAPAPYDITSGTPLVFDGFSLNVTSGTFAAGDRFRIMPTRTAGSDIRSDLKNADELAFASPLKSETSPGNIGTGVITQPSLVTQIDIYDPAAQAALENSLRTAPPLRIVFTSETDYDVVDTTGAVLGSNTIDRKSVV